MINLPYVYRDGRLTGSTLQTELPGKICGVKQAIWMTARRDTISGTTRPVAPCLQCVTTWKDQSSSGAGNNATLMNSLQATNPTLGKWGYPYYNIDYWTGDTTNNFLPFLSFDAKNPVILPFNQPNFLAIPFNTSFAKLKNFTFSTIFRCRRINPNIVTEPDNASGANVVLFQNSSNTDGSRTDGWGVDVGTDEIRIWGHDNTGTFCNGYQGNSIHFPIPDWTKWMRLTVRVSGKTMNANLYSISGKYSPSGNTWVNGCSNTVGSGIQYDTSNKQDWFIAGQRGPDYPNLGKNQTILNGSWDILEYVLYDNWMSDTCVQKIFDYYKYRYNI